jgi:predicted phage tail protein
MSDIQNFLIQDATGSSLGGGSKRPTEEDDSGFSTSVARVLEVISEGRIEGLLNGYRSVFLDETPVENSNGTRNFKGFVLRSRKGNATDIPMPGFEQAQSETNVGVEVKNNLPITRTIINNQCDAIRIRLGLRLVKYEDDGDIVGNSLNFRVLIKEGNGAFVQRLNRTIKGKYSDMIEMEWQFNVRNLNNTVDRFSIRIEKTTAETNSSKNIKQLTFQAYTEVVQANLMYPYTALVGAELDAKQFQNVPSRSFQVGGIITRIPTNATIRGDRSLAYSGVWDGNFYTSTISNNDPVCQIYEILTNKRWGLGNYLDESKIDKWSLFKCSEYCNQLIPDGLGGTEARFQISTVLNTKAGVLQVLDSICSTANIKFYWDQGVLNFWQDRPDNIVRQFTQADVENGDFNYSSTSIRSRSTVARVTYNDPTNFYKQDVEIIEDKSGIEKYGVREKDIVDFGGCSRSQAIRKGKWFLYSSLKQIETVTFVARAYAAFTRPGDIIQIADPNRSLVRYGGLIKSGSGTTYVVDNPVSIRSSSGVTITVMLPNGTLETRNITTGISTTDTLTINAAFSQTPLSESNWILSAPDVNPQLFRVLSVTPTKNDPTKVEIFAITHNPNKYAEIENNLLIPTLPTRVTPSQVVNPPTNAIATQNTIVTSTGDISYNLKCNWDRPLLSGLPDPFVVKYALEYRRGSDGIFQNRAETSSLEYTFQGLFSGDYTFRVASIDSANKISSWVESNTVTIVTSYHPDTVSYVNRLNARGITITNAHVVAIDNFVNGIYNNGLRDRFNPALHIIEDCCPFAGSAINAVKLWVFSGSPNEGTLNNFVSTDWSASLGLDPGNTNTNKWVGTGVIPSTMFTGTGANSGHLSYFSTKNIANTNAFEIGTSSGGTQTMRLIVNLNGINYTAMYSDAQQPAVSVLTSKGYFIGSRINNVDIRSYLNGSQISINTSANTGTLPTDTIDVFRSSGLFTNRSCGLYTIGRRGFTVAQAGVLNGLVQTLMTALGRT